MLIYNPPHGKSIRVPKTLIFERFVFKEKIHSCAKNIRYSRNSCSKKAVHPSPTHQCRTQADHLYLIQICHISFAYEKRTVLFQNLLTVLYYHSSMSASTYGTTGKVIFLAVHSLRGTYRRYAGLHVVWNLAILKYKRTILIT